MEARHRATPSLLASALLAVALAGAITGCKWVRITVSPENLRQGDVVTVEVSAGDTSHLDHVTFWINGAATTVTSVPHTVSVPTCKYTTSIYTTALTVSALAQYTDGTVKRTGPYTHDLTLGRAAREGPARTYALFVAHDSDQDLEDVDVDMANAFIDQFETYDRAYYNWTAPHYYTTSAFWLANGVDLTISIGHGGHHAYNDVDLSTTAFGNLAHCGPTGDAEFLVFASCDTLSTASSGGKPFWWYWFNESATRLDRRPFSGLHQVAGFRTYFAVTETWFFGWHNNGDDFFDAFAEKLDDGWKFRDAWLDSVGDELDFDDGNNRGAVIYLEKYENDRLSSNRGDVIYGNQEYTGSHQWIESWE